MSENLGIPEKYFDYVLAMYSIGYSDNIKSTIKLISKYLNNNGRFILTWTHPFYTCLKQKDDNVIVAKLYNDEKVSNITKDPDKIKLTQYNLKISTLVNYIVESGMKIDKILEDEAIDKNNLNGYNSNFWKMDKSKICPTTLIIVVSK